METAVCTRRGAQSVDKMPQATERRNVRLRSVRCSTDFSSDFTLVPVLRRRSGLPPFPFPGRKGPEEPGGSVRHLLSGRRGKPRHRGRRANQRPNCSGHARVPVAGRPERRSQVSNADVFLHESHEVAALRTSSSRLPSPSALWRGRRWLAKRVLRHAVNQPVDEWRSTPFPPRSGTCRLVHATPCLRGCSKSFQSLPLKPHRPAMASKTSFFLPLRPFGSARLL